eukprot:5811096-Karenia_brevis.AAC.1
MHIQHKLSQFSHHILHSTALDLDGQPKSSAGGLVTLLPQHIVQGALRINNDILIRGYAMRTSVEMADG